MSTDFQTVPDRPDSSTGDPRLTSDRDGASRESDSQGAPDRRSQPPEDSGNPTPGDHGQSRSGSRPPGISTQCVHAGERRQKPEGSISAPIFTASTYTFESTDELLDYVEGRQQREEYGRYGNPNERSVEAKLAALEGTQEAILYSSGMAAIVGLMMESTQGGR